MAIQTFAELLTRSAALLLVLGGYGAQRFLRHHLDRDQYDYVRDLMLCGALALVALWSDSAPAKMVVALSLFAGLLGLAQRRAQVDLRWGYLLIGGLFSLLGPRISFISLPDGEFYYLSILASATATTLWVGLFPLLLQDLDRIPGMAGHLLALVWILTTGLTAISSQELPDALTLSTGALALLAAFWSRHGHMYRQLGLPLASMWGTLIAGTSMLGISKGVTFSALMLLPLALFAIPLWETSVNVVSRALSADATKTSGGFYQRLVRRGVDHPSSVRAMTLVSAAFGLGAGVLQVRPDPQGFLAAFFTISAALAYLGMVFCRHGRKGQSRRPKLWDVPIDNVSLQYALGKVWSLVKAGKGGTVVTPNALGLYACRRNEALTRAFQGADLILPDGMGLVWGLRFLGRPVQERIAGIDFMDQLCRMAAGAGWGVFFLGGAPGVAEMAAQNLVKRYPGLRVRGAEHGFFADDESEELCRTIRNSGSQLLFVALGVPRQELWMELWRGHLGGVVAMGVGGSFDVFAGTLRRAPECFRNYGLEWLYRLAQEPWRWRRMMTIPLFLGALVKTRLGLDRFRRERDT